MPAKNPRVHVVLENPLYRQIEGIAKRDGVSLSLTVRDLVKEALEIEEDIAVSACADTREKTLKRATALNQTEVWEIWLVSLCIILKSRRMLHGWMNG